MSKKHFFVEFTLRYKTAMRVLMLFGLLRQPREPKTKPAWGKLQGKERSFRNIAEHCVVVGAIANTVLYRLHKAGCLDKQMLRRGTIAAILHDATKRHELEFQLGAETGQGSGHFPTKAEQVSILRDLCEQFCVNGEIEELFSLADLSGGNAYTLSAEEISLSTSKNLVRWVIFLADHMASHTRVVTPHERMEEIKQRYQSALPFERLKPMFIELERKLGQMAQFPDGVVTFVQKTLSFGRDGRGS